MSESSEKPKVEPSETPYIEVSRTEFASNIDQTLQGVVPPEFNIVSEDDLGDLRFRFFNLPDNPGERQQVLEAIRVKGTDRIDASLRSRYDALYEAAARKAGIDPIDVFDTMNAIDLRRNAPAIANPPDVTHLGANALLVYDGKTQNGIRQITAREYTFKNLTKRQEALLAIIGFK